MINLGFKELDETNHVHTTLKVLIINIIIYLLNIMRLKNSVLNQIL